MIRHLLLPLGAALVLAVAPLQAQEKAFLGKTAGEWASQLKSSGDAKQRRNAAFALGKMGTRAFPVLPMMKAAIGAEKDPKVREALLFAMGEICRAAAGARNDVELEQIFLGAVKDADAQVRRSAAFALGCLNNKSAETRQALETALDDREAIVRQNAAWALGQFGLDALPALKKALRDADSFVKRDAASALLQMNDADKVHELLKDLLPLCRDTNSEVRRAALNVLVRIVEPKDREAIPPLRVAMEDRDIENRRNAALALSNIGGEETVIALPVLLEAIKNGDDDLRRQSALAIRNIGAAAAQAVPELIRLLREDQDPKMREYAAFALGGIGAKSEPAIPMLLKKIQDVSEKRAIRIECAMTLARIGPVPAANPIVPDLLALLGNPQQDGKVRERVMWALRVHGESLRAMNGTQDIFARVLKEPVGPDNRMLRYDCAYMLGMIWRKDAPAATLDVLTEFLNDDTIQIFDKTVSAVGGAGNEIKGGAGTVKDRGKGDGRIMAVDALHNMGPARYAGRLAIMKQLKVLAADNATFEPLRKKSAALIKAAQ